MEETVPRRRSSQRPVAALPHCSDFCFGRKLGEGSYARLDVEMCLFQRHLVPNCSFRLIMRYIFNCFCRVVYCTSRHDPSQVYAMKIMDKVHIKKENKVGEITRTASDCERLKCNLLWKFYDPNILLNI